MLDRLDDVNSLAIGLGLVFALAFVSAQIAARVLRSALARTRGRREGTGFRDPIQQRPILAMGALVFVAVTAIAVRPVLAMLGVSLEYGVSLDRISSWLLEEGLRVALIVVLAYVAVRMCAFGIARTETALTARAQDGDRVEFVDRVRTITGLVQNAVQVLVLSAATLMILQELGLDITPLLTAAGIGGLAIGFGAQNLVRDVISGFFLILEDQIHVGDVVSVDGTSGVVESVKLRTIVLRDLSGTVHVIPNGAITILSNLTKDYSFSVIDVGVAYKEDTDRVVEVLRRVGDELRADPAFARSILDALEVLGVNDFADSAVTIKIRIRTRPLQQWAVGRELRRRIKKAFDTEGIEMPFPHVSLYFGEASKPFETSLTTSERLERVARAYASPEGGDAPRDAGSS